ncbi:hypothetical protein [Streptomyces sp. H51]|uniref:hypothetical protein n=1 Tax=Streptomyces sp. H51 TaxID=3111770 RepID=UPI002D77116F|nr:hypothetical protein [Streptomyces sp. H51]
MPQVPDLPDLSDDMLITYQRVLDGKPLSPDTPGLAQLLAMGLVVSSPPAGSDTYTPIEPRHPALGMVERVHTQLQLLTAYMGALPAFLATLQDQFQSARLTIEAIQHLKGRDVVNEYIAREHASARTEIISAQPGHRTPEDLAYSYERDLGALQQGLTMRTLYHSSVRRVATVGDWAKAMTAAGAEIRTLNGRFPRCIIFDRRVAFVPVYSDTGEPPADEAIMISYPLVVAKTAHTFGLFWERAEPWFSGYRGEDDGLSTTPLQRAILRELCLGRTQVQASKNLGVSPAWINEQLGQLRKRVSVQTLNELIYWWAKSPDHDVQD